MQLFIATHGYTWVPTLHTVATCTHTHIATHTHILRFGCTFVVGWLHFGYIHHTPLLGWFLDLDLICRFLDLLDLIWLVVPLLGWVGCPTLHTHVSTLRWLLFAGFRLRWLVAVG